MREEEEEEEVPAFSMRETKEACLTVRLSRFELMKASLVAMASGRGARRGA